MGSQSFALNAPLPNGGNPGLRRYRKSTVTTKEAVWQNDQCAIYSLVVRNPSTSAPVYINLYDLPADNVTVGTTPPVSRYLVPTGSTTGGSGQLIITIAPDALDWFSSGLTIAPVLTDADSAPVGGTLGYVEIRYVGAGGP